jgi:hypothetical protein
MLKKVYLVAAVVGAIVPVLFFAGVFHGGAAITVSGFVPDIFANSGAGGLTADLFISSFVFWLIIFNDKLGPKPWLFIVLNLCIGLSCALPAYLYARLPHEE